MTDKLRKAALEALKELQQLRPQNQSPFWFRITEDLRAALAQPAASGEPANPDPLHLSRILYEMAGAVSLCWEPWPSGVFESSRACGYVAAAIAEIRSRMTATAQPAPARVPLTDEQALEIAVTATPPGSMASRSQIVEAIRLAERHHGIFPSKENPL